MTDSSKTPREYALTTSNIEVDNHKVHTAIEKHKKSKITGEMIHTIEYSAYQALEKELSIVKKQLELCKEQRDTALHSIYDRHYNDCTYPAEREESERNRIEDFKKHNEDLESIRTEMSK